MATLACSLDARRRWPCYDAHTWKRTCLGEYPSRVTSSRAVVWEETHFRFVWGSPCGVLCGLRGVEKVRAGSVRRAVAIESICFRLVSEKASGGTVCGW
jgi:hypothetical protein